MTDPHHLAQTAWKDAETLVERVERTARQEVSPESFFDDLTSGLRSTAGASAVACWVSDRRQRSVLSRSGIAVHDDQEMELDLAGDFAAASHWSEGPAGKARLVVMQRTDPLVRLGLDLRFARPVRVSEQQPLGELAEVVLDLAVPVYLRSELGSLRSQLDERAGRDELIRKLNAGIGLVDSFASIADAVAGQTMVDRVTLLRRGTSRYRLITTSTARKVDRGQRQVRYLERLVETAMERHESFSFTVGQPGEVRPEVRQMLDDYLHHSGVRQIHIESLAGQRSEPVAAMVLERFRIPTDEHPSIPSRLSPLRQQVCDAVRRAIDRDNAPWGLIATRLTGRNWQRTASCAAMGLAITVLAFWLIPVTLKIPVQGRLVAATRSHVFAPCQGIVAEVPLRNGQRVRRGQRLLSMHSPSLDLQQRSVEGELATAQARLSSLLARRSGGSGGAQRGGEVNLSAEERVVTAEMEGLAAQLELLQEQQAALTIASPIDGQVDCWDLQQSLNGRPVEHGQFLLDVISETDGWIIELDVPEKNVNYVMVAQHQQPCRFDFRLRSDPTRTHHGTIERLAGVAHLGPQGQSLVRGTSRLGSQAPGEFRHGATVIAKIHCGQHPLGFVWLRGLIQWLRTRAWL